MIYKKFAVMLLATAVGACARIETAPQLPAPESADTGKSAPHAATAESVASPEVTEAVATKDLWQRLTRGFSLDTQTHQPRVQDYVRYYTKNKSYMKRVSERAHRYIYHVAEELEAAGVPTELALLPIVESGYDPFAYSHAQAAGMWQFTPATGRAFGLDQNWWYDGRRDVADSTRAAAEYFLYLAKRFDNDWPLVLAAYNGGEGTVRRAIRRNKAAGKPTDFWHLKLPRETQRYVPQLLALAEVVGKREQYNTPLFDIPNEPYFAKVSVGSQIDLAQAADLADIEIEELSLLNPGYNRWATDPNGNHQLLLPIAKKSAFEQKLASLPKEQRVSWQRHTVKSGDSLINIAKKYQTTVASIRQTNNLRGNMIRAGSTLLIPVAAAPAGQYAYSMDERLKRKQSRSARRGTEKVTYTVKPGDTFWDISRSMDVSVRQLASWNSMAPGDTLRPGQRLVAYPKSSAPKTGRTTRKLSYKVRSGDSLARIAQKFSLKINDIVKWNRINKKKYLQPGQKLTLYVDVTRLKG